VDENNKGAYTFAVLLLILKNPDLLNQSIHQFVGHKTVGWLCAHVMDIAWDFHEIVYVLSFLPTWFT
jgi:hypothetical protein